MPRASRATRLTVPEPLFGASLRGCTALPPSAPRWLPARLLSYHTRLDPTVPHAPARTHRSDAVMSRA